MIPATLQVEHAEFVEAYRRGAIQLRVVPSKVRQTVDDMYDFFLDQWSYPKRLRRISTIFSLLIIPAVLAVFLGPVFVAGWTRAPSIALAVLFLLLSFRCQRAAIRHLALADPSAYKFLLLQGIIVVTQQSEEGR